jgi:hypothetical protein
VLTLWVLQGKYVKHNDNDGATFSSEQIPHAFSHFSHELSHGRVLVCDVQGVGTYYTDPQIHSEDGESFGSGNCGAEGIKAFFESHKCNSLCRRLGEFCVVRNTLLGQHCSSQF